MVELFIYIAVAVWVFFGVLHVIKMLKTFRYNRRDYPPHGLLSVCKWVVFIVSSLLLWPFLEYINHIDNQLEDYYDEMNAAADAEKLAELGAKGVEEVTIIDRHGPRRLKRGEDY